MTPIALFLTNALPFIVMVAIAGATFGLMFVASKYIIAFSSLIIRVTSSRGTTARNSVAGIFGCECISVGILYITEFLFSYHISSWWGVAAGLLATLLYLFCENIHDASFKKLGVAIDELTAGVDSDAILAEVRKTIEHAKADDAKKADDKATVTATSLINSVENIVKN